MCIPFQSSLQLGIVALLIGWSSNVAVDLVVATLMENGLVVLGIVPHAVSNAGVVVVGFVGLFNPLMSRGPIPQPAGKVAIKRHATQKIKQT